MLRYQAIESLLTQSVQQDVKPDATVEQIEQYLRHSATVIISSILASSSGNCIASYRNTRIPPKPRPDQHDSIVAAIPSANGANTTNNINDNVSAASTVSSGNEAQPYHIDRSMKTKIYALFAASAWHEYANQDPEWVCIETDDALFVIRPVWLKASPGQYLLSVLVADKHTPLGMVSKVSKETAAALESGLAEYKGAVE